MERGERGWQVVTDLYRISSMRCRSISHPYNLGPILLITLLLASGIPAEVGGTTLAGSCDPYSSRCDVGEIRSDFIAGLMHDAVSGPLAQLPGSRSDAARMSLMGLNSRHDDPAGNIHPGLAFLMSATIPGAGQLAEGRTRAFVYLGLEAIAWISHFAWTDAGNKKEGEYEAFARRHWDFDQWRSLAYGDVDTCLTALPPTVDPAEAEATLLEFIETGDFQHYYEDVGKLDTYRAGWNDFDCDRVDDLSPLRREYRSMRVESNDFLEKARFAMTVAFLNRVISAVDAFRTARGARVSVSSNTSLELRLAGSINDPKAKLALRRRW